MQPTESGRWCPRCQAIHPASCPAASRAWREDADKLRPSASERGYGARWQKARNTFLARRENECCAIHMKRGERVPATVVDHRTPHRGDQRLFWDTSNWQALCKTCHDEKTARGE